MQRQKKFICKYSLWLEKKRFHWQIKVSRAGDQLASNPTRKSLFSPSAFVKNDTGISLSRYMNLKFLRLFVNVVLCIFALCQTKPSWSCCLLKILIWSKCVEWVKVFNVLGLLCLWQCFLNLSPIVIILESFGHLIEEIITLWRPNCWKYLECKIEVCRMCPLFLIIWHYWTGGNFSNQNLIILHGGDMGKLGLMDVFARAICCSLAPLDAILIQYPKIPFQMTFKNYQADSTL